MSTLIEQVNGGMDGVGPDKKHRLGRLQYIGPKNLAKAQRSKPAAATQSSKLSSKIELRRFLLPL